MPFKDKVNSGLQRTTGVRLTRETEQQRREAIEAARNQTAQRLRREASEREARLRARAAEEKQRLRAEFAEQRAKQKEQREAERQRREEERAALRARGGDLPTYYDDTMRRTVSTARARTMTGPRKLEALIEATRYIVHHQIPGEIVECGVWRGGSMQAVALTLLDAGDDSRELHLFDTFEGMPPPTEEDTRTEYGESKSAEEMLAQSAKDSHLWAVAGLDDVRLGMAETGYPADKIHYHPGLVEDTTPGEAPETIAILRLDTDWYAPTKHELEHLYDRLSPGGILILDDYGDWDGARKATEEFLARTGHRLFLAPMGAGRIAIKS
jgi:hypothetical protein